MNIIELREIGNISDNIKLSSTYIQFKELLQELKKKQLPQNIIESVNQHVEEINSTTLTGDALRKLIIQKQTKILKLVEKELKIVPKNYYRKLWLIMGMTAFGLPIGVAFALSMGNWGLLGIGFPFGMAIGFAVGSVMDKKAFEEGRQLDIEIK